MKLLLHLFLAGAWAVSTAPPTPSPPPGIVFSAGFTSDMVLQRGQGGVAVYGLVSAADGRVSPSVTVRVAQQGSSSSSLSTASPYSYDVTAVLLPAPDTGIAPFDAGNASVWRAMLRPSGASVAAGRGGQAPAPALTITASCTGCGAWATTATLERVVYGDVYFCSGQSNMALPMHFTYSGAGLSDAILTQGRYANLRIMRYGAMSVSDDYHAFAPRYATTVGAEDAQWYNVTAAAALPEPVKGGHLQLNPLHSFSATCLYFGVGLVDEGGSDDTDVPIGLVQSAVGGTQIEAWLDNATLATCTNTSGYIINATTGANDGYGLTSKLWYGMAAPFVNMSVAGWVWYQGENNCHGTPGNSAAGTGYGCEQAALVRLWRSAWAAASVEQDPTDVRPFGLVSLAAGGSEGAGYNMASMRWSQTANYGLLPNAAMPGTFLAHAFDIGDPWARGAHGEARSNNCSVQLPSEPPAPQCVPWSGGMDWNSAVRPLAPLVRNSTNTPVFMGPIHPRFKHEVGRRLAVALRRNTSGPVLGGCTLRRPPAAAALTLQIDGAAMGAGEDLAVQPFDTNISSWGGAGADASTLMLCTDEPQYDDHGRALLAGNATTCGCSNWRYLREPCLPPCNSSDHGHDRAVWYCATGPGPKPTAQRLAESAARHRRAAEADAKGGAPSLAPSLGWVPQKNPYLAIWAPADLRLGVPTARGPTLDAHLALANASARTTIFSVRYGWPFSSDTCCPHTTQVTGLEVCKPAACPVLSADTNLPLNPFFATINQAGKCQCMAPQECNI